MKLKGALGIDKHYIWLFSLKMSEPGISKKVNEQEKEIVKHG